MALVLSFLPKGAIVSWESLAVPRWASAAALALVVIYGLLRVNYKHVHGLEARVRGLEYQPSPAYRMTCQFRRELVELNHERGNLPLGGWIEWHNKRRDFLTRLEAQLFLLIPDNWQIDIHKAVAADIGGTSVGPLLNLDQELGKIAQRIEPTTLPEPPSMSIAAESANESQTVSVPERVARHTTNRVDESR